jgi:hypothetical protein
VPRGGGFDVAEVLDMTIAKGRSISSTPSRASW